jgi:hypothetical protein
VLIIACAVLIANRATVPRWTAVILGLFTMLIAIPLVHGVIPWAISTLMPRYGWERGKPGSWNWLGLIPVTGAAALLIWILISGIARLLEWTQFPICYYTHERYSRA